MSLERYFDICYNLDNKSTERDTNFFLICHEKLKPSLNLIIENNLFKYNQDNKNNFEILRNNYSMSRTLTHQY